MMSHEYEDTTVYEAIYLRAQPALERQCGLELPAIDAWLKETPETDAEAPPVVRVEFFTDLWFGHHEAQGGVIVIDENVFTGMALDDSKSQSEFLAHLLPRYREVIIEASLSHELGCEADTDLGFDAETLIPRDRFWGIYERQSLSNWYIREVIAEYSSEDLYLLQIEFRKHNHGPLNSDSDTYEYDIREFKLIISWSDYEAAVDSSESMEFFMRKILTSFSVQIDDLPGKYSQDFERYMERVDDSEDDDDDGDDPFLTGELVEGADGRVHFANDLLN